MAPRCPPKGSGTDFIWLALGCELLLRETEDTGHGCCFSLGDVAQRGLGWPETLASWWQRQAQNAWPSREGPPEPGSQTGEAVLGFREKGKAEHLEGCQGVRVLHSGCSREAAGSSGWGPHRVRGQAPVELTSLQPRSWGPALQKVTKHWPLIIP